MRLTIAGLALAFALTGCGGDDSSSAGGDETPPDAPPSETSTAATFKPSPDTSAADLKTTCPEVEAALPDLYADGSTYGETVQTVEGLRDAGDAETQNALAPVITALRGLERAGNDALAALEARGPYYAALDGLALRCNAVGSSALQ